MRILFDTNILLRAIQSGSPAREALLLATSNRHILISADFIMDEVRRAFTYPRVRSRIPLGQAAFEAGLEGLLVPSAAATREANLVCFVDNVLPSSRVEVASPHEL